MAFPDNPDLVIQFILGDIPDFGEMSAAFRAESHLMRDDFCDFFFGKRFHGMFRMPRLSALWSVGLFPRIRDHFLLVQRRLGGWRSGVGTVPVQQGCKTGNFVRQCFDPGVCFLFGGNGLPAAFAFQAVNLPLERTILFFQGIDLLVKAVGVFLFVFIQGFISPFQFFLLLQLPGKLRYLPDMSDLFRFRIGTLAKLLHGFRQFGVFTFQRHAFMLTPQICFFQGHSAAPPA